MVLDHLEAKRLGDHDSDHIRGVDIPPPSTSMVLYVSKFSFIFTTFIVTMGPFSYYSWSTNTSTYS
jgi:hypothetical protein